MNFKKTLKYCLLTNPSIFKNAIDVYDHLFLTNGNGYDWINGELIEDVDYCKNVEESVIKNIQFHFSDTMLDFLEDSVKLLGLKNTIKSKIDRMIKTDIIPAFHVDERMNNFDIPEWYDENGPKTDYNKFKFYPLCKYAKIANIPDNIKNDWLIAAKKMIEIIENNQDIFEDPDNLFPSIKERVNKLYDDRYNKIIYLNDVYEIIGMDSEEVGLGSHSTFMDVYVCRRISDGYTRTFDSVYDMRLINIDDYKK